MSHTEIEEQDSGIILSLAILCSTVIIIGAILVQQF